MLSSPASPSFQVPRPDRGADSSFSVASGMLTPHLDGTRVRRSSPRQGGRAAAARGTADTRLPAAETAGAGLRSRRVERAEATDPSPAPKVRQSARTAAQRLDQRLSLIQEVDKGGPAGSVRGQALFLNLFPCEAGATWFSAGDGWVHLLPDLDLISGPPLRAARGPAAFTPRSAQSAEPEPLYPCVFGWRPRCGVEFVPFCSLTQIRLCRT